MYTYIHTYTLRLDPQTLFCWCWADIAEEGAWPVSDTA